GARRAAPPAPPAGHGGAAESLLEHPRRLARSILGRVDERDAAALAPPTHLDLDLDGDVAPEPFGGVGRLLRRGRNGSFWEEDTGPREQVLTLMLVEIHSGDPVIREAFVEPVDDLGGRSSGREDPFDAGLLELGDVVPGDDAAAEH